MCDTYFTDGAISPAQFQVFKESRHLDPVRGPMLTIVLEVWVSRVITPRGTTQGKGQNGDWNGPLSSFQGKGQNGDWNGPLSSFQGKGQNAEWNGPFSAFLRVTD